MTSSLSHFGIIGSGAWGTALATTLCRAGRDVTLWTRSHELATKLATTRENTAYLPLIPLDPAIQVTADLAAIKACNALILACPAQNLRQTGQKIASFVEPGTPLIIAAKGIELGSHCLMSEIATEIFPGHALFVLSGPSFADEVAKGLPSALTLASENDAEGMARAMTTPYFRLYTTDDIIGTQIGGSIKNVLAIACGIVAGRNLGENARSALITRGLAEIMRLGLSLGARAETLTGLSGLGDIVLTCSSPQSRNMSLGVALGQGKNLSEILANRAGVTEGIATATAALGLARRRGIDMPVVSAVDMILREKSSIDDVITSLLARPLRHESA